MNKRDSHGRWWATVWKETEMNGAIYATFLFRSITLHLPSPNRRKEKTKHVYINKSISMQNPQNLSFIALFKKKKKQKSGKAPRPLSDMSASDPGDRTADIRWPLLAAPEKGSERLTVDEMLQKHCGEFGRWQLKHFILTNLAWALEAFHTMVMIFADREPDWTCVRAGSGCDPAAGVCGLEPGSWRWSGSAAMSTVSEWGLICGDKYKVGLVQALFFGGCMIGQFSLSLSLYN